jgi:hypothetical protein
MLFLRKSQACQILNGHMMKMVRFSSQADCPISKRRFSCGNTSSMLKRFRTSDIVVGNPQVVPGLSLLLAR